MFGSRIVWDVLHHATSTTRDLQMGNFLGGLCREHCVPTRTAKDSHRPCPAWVKTWKVWA